MTPDQIAYETLKIQEIQVWITGVAIFIGPLSGVIFTLWFQGRKEKREAKHKLFLSLMAERKAPISTAMAKELNKIDVVFWDSQKVRQCWQEYYALLHLPPAEPRNHKWLELLSEMAKDLKYSHLTELDIDKFYIPQGHVDDAEFQRHVAKQWARVLEETHHFIVKAKAAEDIATASTSSDK